MSKWGSECVRARVRACVREWVSECVCAWVCECDAMHGWVNERVNGWLHVWLPEWLNELLPHWATHSLSYCTPSLSHLFAPILLVFAFEASYWQLNTTSSQFPANLRLFARWSLHPLDQLGNLHNIFLCELHQSWREHHDHCYHPHELDK